MPLRDWFSGLLKRWPRRKGARGRKRGPATHVIVLDGTMSTLRRGWETNAGMAFKLLREAGQTANMTLYYEAGIQWPDWRTTLDVMMGRGINRQIERAYGVLASRYRPGDRIVLIGYSRGAYAVRSLAGVIDRVGLVRHRDATVRNIRQAYRHYRKGEIDDVTRDFRAAYCHADIAIDAVCVWDTVKALGLRLPVLWRWAETQHNFHSPALGPHVKAGYHALALDETREAYAPVLWTADAGWTGDIEQVWFNGTHGDIGGQINGRFAARPLANIPFVWLMEKVEAAGVALPPGWQDRFERDVGAPSVGTWQGWGKLFLSRRRRIVGQNPSERLHETVTRPVRGVSPPPPKAPPDARPAMAGREESA